MTETQIFNCLVNKNRWEQVVGGFSNQSPEYPPQGHLPVESIEKHPLAWSIVKANTSDQDIDHDGPSYG